PGPAEALEDHATLAELRKVVQLDAAIVRLELTHDVGGRVRAAVERNEKARVVLGQGVSIDGEGAADPRLLVECGYDDVQAHAATSSNLISPLSGQTRRHVACGTAALISQTRE